MDLMPTTKLYDEDAYATDFSAKVLSCEETERDGKQMFAVILDRTLFFPEEGGQTPDTGALDNANVLDVQIDDGIITHYTDIALPVDSEVSGVIDFRHRFSHMQQHTGEHIFSGLVHNLFGYDNVGFHLSDNSVTLDFNGILSEDDIKNVERRVNEAITKDLEVKAYYITDDDVPNLNFRCKKALTGPIRIVEIPGYDICACCAPHVLRTGEIGMLKVIHSQNYKGGVRINILCGFRALDYFREEIFRLDSLCAALTTGRDKLFDNVVRLISENKSLSSQLAECKQKLLLSDLIDAAVDEKNVAVFRKKTDNMIMRNVVNALIKKHSGTVAFFSGDDENGYTFIAASEKENATEVTKALSKELCAKGGGKPEMVQGSVVATKEQIEKVLSQFFVISET